jgi:hypothetical protein
MDHDPDYCCPVCASDLADLIPCESDNNENTS